MKRCSACVKQNAAVKTAIDARSLLAKWIFFDLVEKHTSSLIINFKQAIKSFLVWNIYFIFLISVVNYTVYKSNIKSNCILLCHLCVRSSPEEVFCKKDVLRNFTKFPGKHLCQSLFLKKRLWHRCFPVNFTKFLRTHFLTEHLQWLLPGFQSEHTLYSFRISCSKQAQYLKFKWTITSWKYSRWNIVQTSSLCYVAGF